MKKSANDSKKAKGGKMFWLDILYQIIYSKFSFNPYLNNQ